MQDIGIVHLRVKRETQYMLHVAQRGVGVHGLDQRAGRLATASDPALNPEVSSLQHHARTEVRVRLGGRIALQQSHRCRQYRVRCRPS